MYKKLLIFLIFALISNQVLSQKESFIWYFGGHAGLNFKFDPPHMLTNGANNTSGGTGSICDNNGNLLFYTDGVSVYTKTHSLMKNGTNIGGDKFQQQTGLIVPRPSNKNIYYIFSNNSSLNFSYSIVDMSKQGGFGEVISKNNKLIIGKGTEKVTAVRHSNNVDVWVITHTNNSNAFYAYLITGAGIYKTPMISYCGLSYVKYTGIDGQLKISPDGTKLINNIRDDGFELFYFDTRTGNIMGPIVHVMDKREYFGAEFSPNSNLLYITDQGGHSGSNPKCIWQYDLSSMDSTKFKNSKILITSTLKMLGSCQLAVDGKVYIGVQDTCIQVIGKPNLKGIACNYIPKWMCYYNPTGPGYCYPDFLQSYFFVPDFTYKYNCIGDTTLFKLTDSTWVDSVYWTFGDTYSGLYNNSKLKEPKHYFADTGIYKVSIIVYRDTLIDTFYQNIRISYNPMASFMVKDTLLCIKGNNLNFTNNSTIIGDSLTYEWDFGDSIKEFSKDINHSYLTDSTYRVRLVAISDYGCTDTAYKQITVLPSPSVSFSLSDSVLCLKNNLFKFTNNSTINRKDSLRFVWNFGDSLTDTILNPLHSYLLDDTFQIMLVSFTQEGCRDTAKAQVIVNPSPIAAFSVSDTIQCFKDNYFTLVNKSSINKGTITFNWDFGDSITSKVFETSINYKLYGNYNISLIATSGLGCTDTSIIQVEVKPEPEASFTVNDSIQCLSGNNFSFINNSSIATDSFSSFWNFGDTNYSTKFSNFHSYNAIGSYSVKLFINSLYGCKDSITKKVSINSDAVVTSSQPAEHCGPGVLVLMATAKNGNIGWYDSDTGGVLLYTGNVYITDTLYKSKIYYAEAANSSCAYFPRTKVEATIIDSPSVILITSPASNKGPGILTLSAQSQQGDVQWYDSATGGTLLGTGNYFTTPFLTVTTIYYAEAVDRGCASGIRTPVTATILPNSINDKTGAIELLVYPNPSNDFINISIKGIADRTSISLVDLQGRIKFSKEINPTGNQFKDVIDIKNLAEGMYYIILENQQVFKVVRFGKL